MFLPWASASIDSPYPVAACATGLVSLIRGADLVRSGECDVVLAGSSDASLVPIVLGSFQRLGVLARRFEEPSKACRPFDAERVRPGQ